MKTDTDSDKDDIGIFAGLVMATVCLLMWICKKGWEGFLLGYGAMIAWKVFHG